MVKIKWEYKVENVSSDLGVFELNDYGENGWELICFERHLFGLKYYFKRIKE